MANPLLYPAISEVALITYRSVHNGTAKINPVPYLPIPNELPAVVIVFGILGSLPDRFSRTASLMGWGFVLATALNVFSSSATVTSNTAVTGKPGTVVA